MEHFTQKRRNLFSMESLTEGSNFYREVILGRGDSKLRMGGIIQDPCLYDARVYDLGLGKCARK